MKVKIWKSDADPSTAVEIVAYDVYAAVMRHVEGTWEPGVEHMRLTTADGDGVLRDVEVIVEMEPQFDLRIRRRGSPR